MLESGYLCRDAGFVSNSNLWCFVLDWFITCISGVVSFGKYIGYILLGNIGAEQNHRCHFYYGCILPYLTQPYLDWPPREMKGL